MNLLFCSKVKLGHTDQAGEIGSEKNGSFMVGKVKGHPNISV